MKFSSFLLAILSFLIISIAPKEAIWIFDFGARIFEHSNVLLLFFFREAFFNFFCRRTTIDAERIYVFSYYRSSCYDSTISDGYTCHDNTASSNPNIITNICWPCFVTTSKDCWDSGCFMLVAPSQYHYIVGNHSEVSNFHFRTDRGMTTNIRVRTCSKIFAY